MAQHASKRRRLNPIKPVRQLSSLEKLPVEILEQIFLESDNARFLHASRHLQQRLDCNYVKKAMILRCFQAPDLDEDESPYTELEPISKGSPTTAGRETDDVRNPDAFKNLCVLLGEEWVTMDLIKSVIKDWMWNVANKELRRFMKDFEHPESDLEEALPRLRARLEKCTSNSTKAEIDFFRQFDLGPEGPIYAETRYFAPLTMSKRMADCKWTFMWPYQGDHQYFFRVSFAENLCEGKTPLGYFEYTIARSVPAGHWQPYSTFQKHFITWRADHRLLPARLLRGPWTQSRGDLLKFLFDQCGDDNFLQAGLSVDQIDAAQQGISQAMSQNNPLATLVLLGRCSRACAPLCKQYVIDNCFAADHSCCEDSKAGDEEPWGRLSGSREVLPSLDVPLTTEIVRQCIDDFDAHPLVSLQVLGHLGHAATKVPELPLGFMAKLKRIAEREDMTSTPCLTKVSHAMRKLYSEFVGNGMGCQKVGFTYTHNARSVGANVSLYASHANIGYGWEGYA